jgi:serralysin
LVGGGNSDIFGFSGAFGQGTITDFNLAHDQIYLASNEFANFAAVQSHAQQVGGNTVITLDASDSITLQNTALSSLNAGEFRFL